MPVLGLKVVDHFAVYLHRAAGDLLKACYHAQSSGFSAAGGAYEHHEFLILDIEVEVVDRRDVVVVYLYYIL